MTWTCRLIEKPANEQQLKAGDMFYVSIPTGGACGDWASKWVRPHYLSEYYKQNNAQRQPLIVVLPGQIYLPIDGLFRTTKARTMGGWEVTGEAPFVTVSPSIKIDGVYHGALLNGVISADRDGRCFDANGVRQSFCAS